MDFRNPCRSTSSWLWPRDSSSFFSSDILAFLTHDRFCPSLRSASAIGTGDAGWRRLPASLLNVLAFIQTAAAPALFRIHLHSFFSLLVRYKTSIVENKIILPP